MNFELSTLFGLGLGYLFLLFAIAYAAERRLLPDAIVDHPAAYVLSLGEYAGAFAIYGVVGFAGKQGYNYLNYYLGVSACFILAPLLLQPLLRICRNYRLNSLADLLTFRFRSQWAGSLVTLFMVMALMPLLALQIQAVSESIIVLTHSSGNLGSNSFGRDSLALMFCVVMSVFTMLFGSRHLASRESHRGLVTAIAFESVVKLVALLTAGVVAVFAVFGSFADMQRWVEDNPALLASLNQSVGGESTRMMLVMFFGAAVCLPHFFHMLFAENPNATRLRSASWGLPLYLLLISLPVLPLFWAGEAAGLLSHPDYYSLLLGQHSGHGWVSALVYVGGLSAASGAIIVATLALASMSLNHLLLPMYQPDSRVDIYRWLLRIRRLLIAAIIVASYLLYHLVPGRNELATLGITALSGCLQFLPGVLAVLYWPEANRRGFIAGLVVGLGFWLFGLLLPLASDINPTWLYHLYLGEVRPEATWVAVTSIALGMNALTFILVSLFSLTANEERIAAEVCSLDDLNRPARQVLSLHSADEMLQRLSEALGREAAQREMQRALEELLLERDERRPYALRRLRDRIEINLSALLGPSIARSLVDRALPYSAGEYGSGEDITFIESRLERYQTHLTGLAADLDNLRRYHRQTLNELPIGLCAIGRDREVLMWNQAMAALTGIDANDITGSSLNDLPQPWRELLGSFLASEDTHQPKRAIDIDGSQRWINLHKTASHGSLRDEEVIVVEDSTDTQVLENKLTHHERLASIGRLAAGVAHEIGNPVTGIACLAQNLQYETEEEAGREAAEQILKQIGRIDSIVQSLVNFTHTGREGPSRAVEAVDIHHCVDEAVQLLSLDHEATAVHFNNRCPHELLAFGDRQRLLQVFINLLANARDASPAGSPVDIDARGDNGSVHISVSDRGSGIDPALVEQVFEPFFTTKEPGKGTGLGLALAYNIIGDLSGEIRIESPLLPGGGGTAIHIQLQRYRG